ncbi:hypothetical protein ACQY1G_04895 [Agrobacterium vitis]|uniref:hypothetical protein n=1 Tax=Agrobacterium vitis TaxID=373 RepID=UPI003D26D13A
MDETFFSSLWLLQHCLLQFTALAGANKTPDHSLFAATKALCKGVAAQKDDGLITSLRFAHV